MNAVKKPEQSAMKTILGESGGDIIRLLLTGCMSFIIPLLIKMNNTLTTIQINQATDKEVMRDGLRSISENKDRIQVLTNDIFDLRKSEAIKDEKISQLQDALHNKNLTQ